MADTPEQPQTSEFAAELDETVNADRVASGEGGVDPRFSNPRHMGFMRVIMVVQAITVVLTVVPLISLSKDAITFGFSDYWLLLNMLFSAVGFWLLWKRKASARPVLIVFSALNIIQAWTTMIVTGALAEGSINVTFIWDVVILIYMATSRRARAVLVRPFQDQLTEVEQSTEVSYYQPTKWPFWRNLIIYFCVFSIVGHWMEAGYCLLIKYGILPGIYDPTSQIWSDWLYPFPVYGFGACACVLLLYPIKLFLQRRIQIPVVPLVLSFVINGSVCCLIELIMGLMTNMDYSLWDYRDMFGNFMGQICLQNGLAFGAVATLMTWVIYPALEFAIARVNRSTMTVVFIVIVAFFAILWTFYLVDFDLPDPSVLMESLGFNPVDAGDGGFSIEIEDRQWGT